MTWVQLDDRWDLNSKLERASEFPGVGDSAWSVWSRAVTHCNRELTDGRVHGATLRARTKNRKPQAVIDALVKVGALLVVGDDEYEIHDYLDWNPDRKTVEARRGKKREAASRGGIASGRVRQKSANVEPNANETEARCFDSGSTETDHPGVKPIGVKSSPSPSPDQISENSEMQLPIAGAVRGSPPPPVSETAKVILGALKAHDVFAPIATMRFAQGLEGRIAHKNQSLELALVGIDEAAFDAAEAGLGAEALSKKVRTFVDNARRSTKTSGESPTPTVKPSSERLAEVKARVDADSLRLLAEAGDGRGLRW